MIKIEERIAKVNSLVENCKQVISEFDMKFMELKQSQKYWQQQTEKQISEKLELQIKLVLNNIEEN